MIDIHSHILFGVDDGCFQLETAMQVLKEENNGGVTDFILTPHIDTFEFDVEKFRKHFNILQNAIKEENLNINIYKGAEVGPDFVPSISIKKGINLTLGENGKYLLVGPFFTTEFNVNQFNSVIYDLQTNGIIPIIAHPERMHYFRNDPELLLSYVNRGCLLQINGPSLLGKYGEEIQNFVNKIIKLKWVTFVGSDNHRPHNGSIMHKTYTYIKSNYSEELAKELMVDNPKNILNNQAIVNYDFKDWIPEKKKHKSFFNFFKKK